MEYFLDEAIRRISLCDDLPECDVEATLQGELMHSHDLKVQMTAYLQLPQSSHHSAKLIAILTDQCEIRDVLRRNRYEEKLNKEGFKDGEDKHANNPGRQRTPKWTPGNKNGKKRRLYCE